MGTFIITKLIIDCVYRHDNENPRRILPFICLISVDRLLVLI